VICLPPKTTKPSPFPVALPRGVSVLLMRNVTDGSSPGSFLFHFVACLLTALRNRVLELTHYTSRWNGARETPTKDMDGQLGMKAAPRSEVPPTLDTRCLLLSTLGPCIAASPVFGSTMALRKPEGLRPVVV
jgi:hypothetical protein